MAEIPALQHPAGSSAGARLALTCQSRPEPDLLRAAAHATRRPYSHANWLYAARPTAE